jgi:hypothetical protein
MAQAVGEFGEVALEVGEIEHWLLPNGFPDRISGTGPLERLLGSRHCHVVGRLW